MGKVSDEKLWKETQKINSNIFDKFWSLKERIEELENRVEVLEKKIGAEFCPHCGKVVEFKEKK
jgi:hypothetical protein